MTIDDWIKSEHDYKDLEDKIDQLDRDIAALREWIRRELSRE